MLFPVILDEYLHHKFDKKIKEILPTLETLPLTIFSYHSFYNGNNIQNFQIPFPTLDARLVDLKVKLECSQRKDYIPDIDQEELDEITQALYLEEIKYRRPVNQQLPTPTAPTKITSLKHPIIDLDGKILKEVVEPVQQIEIQPVETQPVELIKTSEAPKIEAHENKSQILELVKIRS